MFRSAFERIEEFKTKGVMTSGSSTNKHGSESFYKTNPKVSESRHHRRRQAESEEESEVIFEKEANRLRKTKANAKRKSPKKLPEKDIREDTNKKRYA